MKEERIIRAAVLAIGPVSLWGLHFGTVYAVQHVACAAAPSTAPLIVGAATVLATLATYAGLALIALDLPPVRQRSREELPSERSEQGRFLKAIAQILAVLSAIAVIWTNVAVIMLPTCPALR
jgi:hypothetical protein